MITFWLFFSFLFGAVMLMLALGYIDTEKRRAREQREREADGQRLPQVMANVPRFFARSDAAPMPPAQVAFADKLLADLERHVRSEQALVNQFVKEPSIESLYRQPTSPLDVN